MKYQVRYLADGDEETAEVEADNAPEAVEAAQAEHEAVGEADPGQFELLAVVPEPAADPASG